MFPNKLKHSLAIYFNSPSEIWHFVKPTEFMENNNTLLCVAYLFPFAVLQNYSADNKAWMHLFHSCWHHWTIVLFICSIHLWMWPHISGQIESFQFWWFKWCIFHFINLLKMYVLICDIYVFGYFWCDTIFKYDYKQKMLMGCYNIDGDQPKFSCVCIQYLKKKKHGR